MFKCSVSAFTEVVLSVEPFFFLNDLDVSLSIFCLQLIKFTRRRRISMRGAMLIVTEHFSRWKNWKTNCSYISSYRWCD